MRAISAVAVNVFKESVRDRVPYNLALFAVLLIGASYLLGQLTAGQDVKIIKDLGLAATTVFGLFIAIFIGIGLVSKEVERRSIYALLAKPISRPQFIVGKYAGLVLTLAANVAVMTLALYAVLAYLTFAAPPQLRAAWDAPGLDPRLLQAIALIFVQLMIITAIALFFSTFSSPMLAAALTFGFFVVGHFNADLKNFDRVMRVEAGDLAGARRLPRRAGLLGLRHQDRGRPRPAGRRRLPRRDDRLRTRLHRRAAGAVGADLLAAGLQVTADRRLAGGAALAVAAFAAAIGLQMARDAAYPRDESAERALMYVQSPAALRPHRALLRRACRRRLLDSGAAALRRRPACRRRSSASTSSSIRCST